MRPCPKCGRLLADEDFNWKVRGIRRAFYCKECSREYIKEHYKKNTSYYIAKAKVRKQKVRQEHFSYIESYLERHPCVDCGETDILVLEFDHRDRKDKCYDISVLTMKGVKLQRVIDEIAKCDVRCSNCHRRRTQVQSNSWRLKYAPVA